MTSVLRRGINRLGVDPQTPTRPGFRADIQGLRAVAVGLVVLGHAGVPGLGGGFVGVDVFFVISGFLITGHLVGSLRATGRIDLAGFYARRARRILPAALVVVVATVAAAVVLVPPLRLPEILKDAAASALYVPNLLFAAQKTDYLAGTAPSPFQHYWSLGVEEQFYLVWPLLLLLAFVLARRSARWLVPIVGIAAGLSFAACLLVAPVAQSLAFFALPTRAWELAVGGLVAAAVPLFRRAHPRIAVAGGWLGLGAILVAALEYGAGTAYPGVATLVPVLGTAAVLGFGTVDRRPSVAVLLGVRPFQFVGRISYSLYLVHWPLLVLAHERLGRESPLPLWLSLALALLAVPLAFALYRLVESPLRYRAGQSVRRTLVAAVAVPVVLALAAAVAIPAVGRLPLHTGQSVAPTTITAPPDATGFVPSDMLPVLSAAAGDTGELAATGCQQSLGSAAPRRCVFGDPDSPFVVALFGDSHAGRWFPALERVAKDRGVRLETFVKSGCRSEDTDSAWRAPENATCAAWRAAVIARLADDRPNVIVLTNHVGPSPGRDEGIMRRDWERGIASTLARLPAASRVVTIADTPQFAASPVICLSAHLADAAACSVSRDAALNPAVDAAQRAVGDRTDGGYVDLTDYLCGATRCPPVIGSTLVYSDEHHMTATFSRLLAPALEEALAPYLPAR